MNEIIQALKEYQDRQPEPFDTIAEVIRVEGDTAWVQMPGSDDETPVRLTINATEGETVQVRVSGGDAFLVGNESAPPTDDKQAYVAQAKAEEVQADLNEQKEYFWHDDDGAHIQGNLSGYRNDLKSDGMHIVEVATGQDVAMFTADGSRIGKTDKAHISMDYHSLQFKDMDSRIYFYVFDLRNESGIATVSIGYYGDGVSTDFTTDQADAVITHVYVDGEEQTSGFEIIEPQYDSPYVQFDDAPDEGAYIKIEFETDSSAYKGFTFGSRKSLSNVGRESATFGTSNAASGSNSFADGFNSSAEGNNSHAHGVYSTAGSDEQFVIGKYNKIDRKNKYAYIIGNGTGNSDTYRSNAFAVDWYGNVDTPSGRLTAQKTTTTWTAPTASGATKTAGGYYAEGKHIYVSISCTLTSAASAGDNVTLFTGLTAPLFMVPLEVMVANQRNGVAWINDSGELHFRPSASVSTSNAVIINGHYTSA